MYVLIVSARVKPEQRGRFLEAIEENAVTSVRCPFRSPLANSMVESLVTGHPLSRPPGSR